MSVEKVLRQIGGDEANALADAWHEYERDLGNQFAELHKGIHRSTFTSTVSITLAGITLAGLIGVSYLVGSEVGGLKAEIGGLKERVGGVERRLETVETRLGGLEGEVRAFGETLKAIDERTRRMETEQRAGAE